MKIGFIGFGEVNSPREMLEEKIAAAKERLMKKGLEVYDGGLVTDDIDRKEAAAAVERLRDKKFDVLIICLAAVSYTHLDVYKRQDIPCVRFFINCN